MRCVVSVNGHFDGSVPECFNVSMCFGHSGSRFREWAKADLHLVQPKQTR
jgi:hypothetical protein